ncbi:PilZ domain-containing protein [Sphingomonas abietis]|uniref:PilZ domain-containing protein n=1 Tax=Sphingomonas abietis TaxID=3012344 RepID=UPI003899DAEB
MGAVTIENLSVTGCAFRADFPLEIGTVISIGMPGIGTRGGRVTRSNGEEHGCSFFLPITEEEIAQAMTEESAPQTPLAHIRDTIRAEEEHKVAGPTEGSAWRQLLRAARARLGRSR